MRSFNYLAIAAAVLVLASSRSTVADANVRPEHAAVAPMELSVDGPDHIRPGRILDLEIRLVRHGWHALPLQYWVQVPVGAKVVAGQQKETIVDKRSPVIVRHLRIVVSSVPKDDVVVGIDAEAAGGGIHARATYRFGRPTPAVVQPPTVGPSMQIGNIRVGPSIPLQPR